MSSPEQSIREALWILDGYGGAAPTRVSAALAALEELVRERDTLKQELVEKWAERDAALTRAETAEKMLRHERQTSENATARANAEWSRAQAAEHEMKSWKTLCHANLRRAQDAEKLLDTKRHISGGSRLQHVRDAVVDPWMTVWSADEADPLCLPQPTVTRRPIDDALKQLTAAEAVIKAARDVSLQHLGDPLPCRCDICTTIFALEPAA